MNSPKYAWLIFGGLFLAMIAIGYAFAEESPKLAPACDFVPTPANTSLHYECDSSVNGVRKTLVGEADIYVWICGKKYTFEVTCK